jgi:hypothetical protein
LTTKKKDTANVFSVISNQDTAQGKMKKVEMQSVTFMIGKADFKELCERFKALSLQQGGGFRFALRWFLDNFEKKGF